MTAELAAALCIPDAAANALLSESVALVHDRPRTLAGSRGREPVIPACGSHY